MTFTWRLQFHPEVDSTNLFAARLVLTRWENAQSAHGIGVLAHRQTAGRGQHGRIWASPVGGLYLSAVLEDFPPTWRDRLALVAGLAVVNALEPGVHASACSDDPTNSEPRNTLKRELRAGTLKRELCPSLQIRWPNDILLAGKKVAGILCEALSQGDRFAAIIGIGINVHTQPADLPEEIRPLATSLHSHDITPTLNDLTHAILNALSALLQEAPTLPQIVHRLQPRDALRHQSFQFDDGHQIVTAIGAGIQDDGALLLQLPDGTLRPFSRGSIVSLPLK